MRNDQLNAKLQLLGSKLHSEESAENVLVNEFRENKYKQIQYSFIVAYLLFIKRGMNDELAFHLFCHAAHMGMFSIACGYLMRMEDNEFYRELIRAFPIPEDLCADQSRNAVIQCMNERSGGENVTIMFETGIYLLRMGCNESETMIMDALKRSESIIMPRLILKYHDALTDMHMHKKAMDILEKFAMHDNAHPSVMYRYGKSLEETDSIRALDVFRKILEKYDDYLDTEERISNLTNKKKHSKIYNYEQEEDIHFS